MKKMEVPTAAGEVDYKEYDIWADRQFCEQCQMNKPCHLMKYMSAAYFCFVPLLKQTVTRFLVCEECGHEREIAKADYMEIRQRQHERLENGMFPKEIIERDIGFKKTECRGKLISLLFALIFMPIMLGFFVLLLTVYTFIPLIYSAWDYFKSKKELKLYKRG